MRGPLVVLATLAVVAGLVGSPLTDFAFGKFMGEHAAGGMNLTLAAIAVSAALAAIAYAWAMYIKGWIEPDWYMKSRFVEIVLARHFRIDEAYDLVLVKPVIATSEFFRKLDAAVIDGTVRAFGVVGFAASRVLSVFDRKGVDGAVDGLGDGVVSTGGQIRRMLTGNVQTYLLLFVASILVLVAVFAR